MTHRTSEDFRTGDPFPPPKAIRAPGRSLTTFPGENPDQYVFLWSGEPVIGRIWNGKGNIAASFSWVVMMQKFEIKAAEDAIKPIEIMKVDNNLCEKSICLWLIYKQKDGCERSNPFEFNGIKTLMQGQYYETAGENKFLIKVCIMRLKLRKIFTVVRYSTNSIVNMCSCLKE
uniref:Uncharacterized protein n=1 Tax=Ditylenchus dipsaci TaxID=166011 RepID=A0A915CZI8_9BILA